jgi:crotonobetainyl-CoA:carnitine CoA-transferase CaiB-like acyl-CoA transferase
MRKPMNGVRVVEVASWTFVPAAGAMLADMGADVIKVEPPTGDPQRSLRNMLNLSHCGPNPFLELPNRGKRSITLDLGSAKGHELLLDIVDGADVFLTSYLPESRVKLGFDVDAVRERNPDIIYVRGSGWGSKGPMDNTGGFDLAAGWASSGLAHRMTPDGGEPPMQPPAFFDLQGSTAITAAVSTALFNRERTGESSVVDVSLLNVGMWAMGPDIVGAPYVPTEVPSRYEQGNPLTNWFPTKDGRWIYLVLLQADRYWAELCAYVGAAELVVDERFTDAEVRYTHRVECVNALTEVFLSRTLDEWKDALRDFSGVWAPVQSALEVHEHAQVQANGFLPQVRTSEGVEFALVAPPMHFDGEVTAPTRCAPALGADTDEVLRELGYDAAAIVAMRQQKVFG